MKETISKDKEAGGKIKKPGRYKTHKQDIQSNHIQWLHLRSILLKILI